MVRTGQKLKTRDRLIVAAGRLFAEKGYGATRVRDICSSASANVAAVHYHFGDKARLYEEVIDFIFKDVMDKFPINDVSAGFPGSSREDLFEFVRAMLFRRHDPDRPEWEMRIIAQERMNPDSKVFLKIREEVKKVRVILLKIIVNQLGPDCSSELIEQCAASIMGQALYPGLVRGMHGPSVHSEEPMTAEKIEETARHIADFSIAGIRQIKKNSRTARHVEGRSE